MIGTSGTIESVQSVLIANGFASGSITREGVAELEHAIVERRWLTDLGVPGLAPERVDIFPAGLAALSAVLETLDIARVEFVDASLQHGLLYDLAARRAEENVQERTVEGWRRRFNVDRDQATSRTPTSRSSCTPLCTSSGISTTPIVGVCSVGPQICTRSG